MAELLSFAAVEQGVSDWLWEQTSIAAGPTVPNPRPGEFVEVMRTGGARPSMVTETAQVTVLTSAATRERAEVLANEARSVMDRIRVVDGHTVYAVSEVGGPAWSPDPDTDRPRFQFTVILHIRLTTTQAP